MLDTILTNFERKNVASIEKKLDQFEDQPNHVSSNVDHFEFGLTEAVMFPFVFRKHYLVESRLIYNSFIGYHSFQNYHEKIVRDRAYKGDGRVFSLLVYPSLKAEFSLIDFYEEFMSSIINHIRNALPGGEIRNSPEKQIDYAVDGIIFSVRISTQSIKFHVYNSPYLRRNDSEVKMIVHDGVPYIANAVREVFPFIVSDFISKIYNLTKEKKPVLTFKMGLFHKEYGVISAFILDILNSGNIDSDQPDIIYEATREDISKELIAPFDSVFETYFQRFKSVLENYGAKASYYTYTPVYEYLRELYDLYLELDDSFFEHKAENAVFVKEKPSGVIRDFGSFSGEELGELFDLAELPSLSLSQKESIRKFFLV